MLRVGFDYRPAQMKNSRNRGIGRYTANLFCALAAHRDEALVRLMPYGLPNAAPPPEGAGLEWRKAPFLKKPSRLNWLLDRWVLPRRIRADRIDLFHAQDPVSIPISKGCRSWATVHDAIPFIFWKETVRRTPWDFRLALTLAGKRLRRVERIITISECSKRDLCARLGIEQNRISVVYGGCDPHIKPIDPKAARVVLQSRYHLESPFLFYVGGADFRKNLSRLAVAFASLIRLGYKGKLVLAGETFLWDFPEVRELKRSIDSEGISRHILMPGFVPDTDLAAFYAACDLFVFPSQYEGFGLPVLEAMTCGAAIAAGKVSAIPEVAGDAAFYFDPNSTDSMVEAIWEALSHPEEVERKRAAGLERAKSFGWDRAAQQILDLYVRDSGESPQ